MGTDIHMGAERFDREAGRWGALGRVFESRYDWDFRPITRELLDMLDAPTLLRAFNFHVTHKKYGEDMAPFLSAETLAVFKRFDARMGTLRHDLERHRKVVSAEGWDYYGKVKPFEDAQNRALRREFMGAFGIEQFRDVIGAALRYAETQRAKYADEPYEESVDVHLERWPDDPPFMTAHPYQSRHYTVFALLGNVRNGHGFAGVDTGDPIPPISDCRGVPGDADPETLKLLSNEHSATWVTLAELDAYDYDQGKVNCGVVSGETYDVMRALEQDDPYHPDVQVELTRRDPTRSRMDAGVSGWISGRPGIVTFDPAGYEHWKQRGEPGVRQPQRPVMSPDTPVDEEEVARQVVLGSLEVEVRPYVQIRWMTPLRDNLGDEFFQMIENLRRHVPEGGTTDDIRVVCDFDS